MARRPTSGFSTPGSPRPRNRDCCATRASAGSRAPRFSRWRRHRLAPVGSDSRGYSAQPVPPAYCSMRLPFVRWPVPAGYDQCAYSNSEAGFSASRALRESSRVADHERPAQPRQGGRQAILRSEAREEACTLPARQPSRAAWARAESMGGALAALLAPGSHATGSPGAPRRRWSSAPGRQPRYRYLVVWRLRTA
jgi:hypothetical protein